MKCIACTDNVLKWMARSGFYEDCIGKEDIYLCTHDAVMCSEAVEISNTTVIIEVNYLPNPLTLGNAKHPLSLKVKSILESAMGQAVTLNLVLRSCTELIGVKRSDIYSGAAPVLIL